MSEQQQTLTIQQALNLAVQHHNAGRLSEAETIYQQILQTDPDQPVALHLLGVIAHQVGKNDVAVDLINKALVMKPDYAEALNNLGSVFKAMGMVDDAETSCRKALTIMPDFAEAHNNLGLALQGKGRLEEAVASYRKALALKPEYIEAYFNCGFATELQEGKEPFDPQLVLDQCFAEILLDNYSDATRIMDNLCLNRPYNTQQYIRAFIDRWCQAIMHMLDNQQFDIARQRIRWLYMRITDHKPFDALIQRYFEETKNEKTFTTMGGHEKAVHLSMQSQYFYQNGQYNEAEECAKRCVNETRALLESECGHDDAWLLVKKSLKNIKDSEKARNVLEQLLLSMA